ncbi:MAG: DUF6527 family protein [Pyrinomonadaceae bacterium]
MIHKFVEFFPDALEDDVLYVSFTYATVNHKCACGCGNEVVTPLSPTDWKLTFDGVSITLYPSIGNWNFDCRSHYWIRDNKVVWSNLWTDGEITAGRNRDHLEKQEYYNSKTSDVVSEEKTGVLEIEDTILVKIKKWLTSFFKSI